MKVGELSLISRRNIDMVDATKQEVQLTPDQAYLKGLLDMFNADPNSADLDDTAKMLLGQIQVVQQEIAELAKQIEELNGEIRERQEKGNGLVQQVVLKQGESQGYINTLLKLRK